MVLRPDSMTLGVMCPEDVPVVASIESAQHLTPWTPAGFLDALRQGWHARVLREGSQSGAPIVGYYVALTTGDDEELLTITVAPEHAGRGFGRILLESLLEDARQRGAERLLLEVRQSNARAIHLYASAGFTIDGMRKAYYAVPADPSRDRVASREDAVLMSCVLQEPKPEPNQEPKT